MAGVTSNEIMERVPAHSDSVRVWRRYGLYCAALLLALLLYVPFRLLASHTNTIFMAGSDDFYFRSAIFVWPAYTLLSMGIVYFTSGVLGFSLVPDLFALVFLLACSDYTWHLDNLLGFHDMGGTGSWTTSNGMPWNTTWLSQELCLATIPLGLVLGKAAGLLLNQCAGGQSALRETRYSADWRTVGAHVLNAGFAAPALAYICGCLGTAYPLEDPGVHSASQAVIFLSALAIGYTAGIAFSLGVVLRGRRLQRPERSARVASVIYALLLCGWGFASLSLGGWGAPGRVPVCALTALAIVAFVVLTRRRFAQLGPEACRRNA